jgi:hypothetical protein
MPAPPLLSEPAMVRTMGIEEVWIAFSVVRILLLLCAIKVPNASVKELYQA